MAQLAANTFNDKSGNIGTIYWEGGNTKEARKKAAIDLFNLVSNHNFKDGEPLILVAHSHGGNVIKEFTNLYDLAREITSFVEATGINIGNQSYSDKLINYKKIDEAVLVATPHRNDHKFDNDVMAPNKKPITINDENDILTQDIFGGTDTSSDFPFIHPFDNPSKTMEDAVNISVEQLEDKPIRKMIPLDIFLWMYTGNRPQQSPGIIESHTKLNTTDSWKNYIDPAIKKHIGK